MAILPELLSPCGSPQALQAAVFAGADAVYMGLGQFNARINAANFDLASLQRAVDFCHSRGVRVYLTLNTLVGDRQLLQALELVDQAHRAGVDAFIVADLGLTRLIKQNFPRVALHASTQFSCHNPESARWLEKECGVSRVVCARELSLPELTRFCQQSPVEVEMFVHGALCASHSGQCLLSYCIGGRSGNRGECAQPCRLGYNNSYPLSLKDLCLAGHIRQILSLPVASLKIEGRMKSPQYVYRVTSVYRRLLDEGRNATDRELESLMQVFSRSGFTDGYFVGDHSRMLGVRREQDKQVTRQEKVAILDRAPRRAPIGSPQAEQIVPILPQRPNPFVTKALTARFLSPAQIPSVHPFQIVYLPLEHYDPNKANGVVLPSVILPSQMDKVKLALEKAYAQGARHALVGNLGHVELAKSLGYILHGDLRLNVVNSYACPQEDAFEDYLVSPELNLAQIRDLKVKKSVVVYGRIPVMILERRVGCHRLRDRKGMEFPVVGEGARDIVYNSTCLYMADRKKELKNSGIFSQHFIFTNESLAQVESVLGAYDRQEPAPQGIRRIR